MRTHTIPTLLAGILMAGPAVAQHPPHGDDHAAGLPAHLEAQPCLESFDRIVAEGRGFGMAFAADRNGYPGPLHLLELREALALTTSQESRIRALESAMPAESRPQSAALLAAERRLDSLFMSGRAAEADLASLAREAERLRGEVPLIHLRYHLKTRDLLTEQQRSVYHERRWRNGAAGGG